MQVILQHICKTSSIAMLRVLPLRNQTCLAANQVVASCVNTDFWLDKLRGNHAIHGSYVTSYKTSLPWEPVKRATWTDFVAKSRTTLSFLQQIFATCNNLICWKTGLKETSKTSNIVIQLVLQQCCKTSCTVLLTDLPWLNIPWYGTLCLPCRISK